jgi:hypothetical protein
MNLRDTTISFFLAHIFFGSISMVKRKLSDILDGLDEGKKQTFWQARLLEMQLLLKEKKYSALARRIGDLLESDRVTSRTKPSNSEAKNRAE